MTSLAEVIIWHPFAADIRLVELRKGNLQQIIIPSGDLISRQNASVGWHVGSSSLLKAWSR